jgi:hypothetical protein
MRRNQNDGAAQPVGRSSLQDQQFEEWRRFVEAEDFATGFALLAPQSSDWYHPLLCSWARDNGLVLANGSADRARCRAAISNPLTYVETLDGL